MNPFGFVKGLFNRAANTVNNDVLKPIQRDITKPVISAYQAANPFSGANQGKQLQQQANNRYQFTPQFQAILNSAHPSLNRGNLDSSGGDGLAGYQADGLSFGPQSPLVNQIQIAKNMVGGHETQDALVHEGLHQQWASNPQDRQNFINAYNQELKTNPQQARNLQSYLAGRLQGYKNAPNGGKLQLDEGGVPIASPAYNNLNTIDPTIVNEIHSYIPQYMAGGYASQSDPLAHYYSQFFNPSRPTQFHQVAQSLINQHPGVFMPGGSYIPQQQGQQ